MKLSALLPPTYCRAAPGRQLLGARARVWKEAIDEKSKTPGSVNNVPVGLTN